MAPTLLIRRIGCRNLHGLRSRNVFVSLGGIEEDVVVEFGLKDIGRLGGDRELERGCLIHLAENACALTRERIRRRVEVSDKDDVILE